MKRADPGNLDRITDCIKPWSTLGWSMLLGVTVIVVASFWLPRTTAAALGYLSLMAAMFLLVLRALFREPAAFAALVGQLMPSSLPTVNAALLVGIVVLGAVLQQVTGSVSALTIPANPAATPLNRLELTLLFPTLIVLAPISEELVFRYAIQRRLQRRTHVMAALVLTAAIFGALHGLNALTFGSAFILGVMAGLLAATPGFVAMPVALHFGWNLAAFIGMASH